MTNQVALPYEDQNTRHIQEELKPLFGFAEQAWDIALTFIAEKDKTGIGKTRYFNLCLAGVFAKQMRLYVANYRLCRQGLDAESLLLCRAMFEAFVNLKALTQCSDPDEYARLWIIWDLANDEKNVAHIIGNHPESEANFLEMKAGLSSEKATLGPDAWELFVRKGPSRKNLRALCEELGLGDAYAIFYSFASGAAHGYDILSYARPAGPEQIQTNLSPTIDLADSSLATGIAILRDSLALINANLGLQKTSEVDKLTKIVEQANQWMTDKQSAKGSVSRRPST